MNSIREAVELYLYSYPPALELFQKLMQIGEIYLIGGILREYKDKGRIEELRDADFVVNIRDEIAWKNLLEAYQPERNHFGGYKFYCTGFLIDAWEAEKTWAYRNELISFDREKCLQTLPGTVFLNLDSIIYDLSKDMWYDDLYQEAKRTGILDVVLEDNPYIDLNIMRAMVLRRKYNMTYSEKLKEIILKQYKQDSCYIESLLEIQYNRYHKEIITRDMIEQELKLIG